MCNGLYQQVRLMAQAWRWGYCTGSGTERLLACVNPRQAVGKYALASCPCFLVKVWSENARLQDDVGYLGKRQKISLSSSLLAQHRDLYLGCLKRRTAASEARA
jgi:hypothetical protein